MKFNISRRMILASIAGSFLNQPALAMFGGVVIDPSNLVQNTSSALAAVKNEVNTAKSYITHMQQLVAMGKSLKSLNGLASLAGVEQELALYMQLKSTSTQLVSVVESSLELSRRVQSQFGASGLSWNDFLRSRSAIDQGNTKALSAQYTSITEAISQIAARRKAIVGELQGAEGQTSAMQSVGAGIDVLIGQNQQLIATLAAEGQAKLIQKNVDSASVQQGMQIISDRQRRILEADAKIK
ncbi:hypothetical protein [Pseudoduganella sp. OTU4001]|uniref:hypothetical protein n=1 Tax=Pseudoduganella sp. OTU4001 TaxID=3043854 RepID=UPI00313AAAE4